MTERLNNSPRAAKLDSVDGRHADCKLLPKSFTLASISAQNSHVVSGSNTAKPPRSWTSGACKPAMPKMESPADPRGIACIGQGITLECSTATPDPIYGQPRGKWAALGTIGYMSK
ncbi:MAG TPA: hypothetical protein VGL00_11810 [Terracidiphilus sp.]